MLGNKRRLMMTLGSLSVIAGLACGQEDPNSVPIAAEECFLDSSPNGLGGSFVSLAKDRLRYYSDWQVFESKDGGRTWGEQGGVDVERDPRTSMRDVVRLQSGHLGLLGVIYDVDPDQFRRQELLWWRSRDEGETWEGPIQINRFGGSGVPYSGGVLLQMNQGRLVLPVRHLSHANSAIRDRNPSRGKIAGTEYVITDHALHPEFEASFCYFSDDEGATWSRSEGDIMIWLNDGLGGIWPMDEPCVVEAPEGVLSLYGRTTLGRIFRAKSEDGGAHWEEAKPTSLASSYSPCRVVSLPQSETLLCLWNQLSADEIRSGHWRGRLSCALSHDHGETWEDHKMIDLQGVEPRARIEAGPIEMVRPRRDLGDLPRGYGNVSYPTIGFHQQTALIRYKRRVYWPRRKNSDRMLVIPIDWFSS